jgi:peptide/nickel transport system ATP-binding protein
MELMRLAPPESGSVELLGTPITDDLTSADRSRIRSGVQLVM